jgi:hypothetical protein
MTRKEVDNIESSLRSEFPTEQGVLSIKNKNLQRRARVKIIDLLQKKGFLYQPDLLLYLKLLMITDRKQAAIIFSEKSTLNSMLDALLYLAKLRQACKPHADQLISQAGLFAQREIQMLIEAAEKKRSSVSNEIAIDQRLLL